MHANALCDAIGYMARRVSNLLSAPILYEYVIWRLHACVCVVRRGVDVFG